MSDVIKQGVWNTQEQGKYLNATAIDALIQMYEAGRKRINAANLITNNASTIVANTASTLSIYEPQFSQVLLT